MSKIQDRAPNTVTTSMYLKHTPIRPRQLSPIDVKIKFNAIPVIDIRKEERNLHVLYILSILWFPGLDNVRARTPQ